MNTANKHSHKHKSVMNKVLIFTLVMVPVVAILCALGWYICNGKIDKEIASLESREMARVTKSLELTEHCLEFVARDLLVLASHAGTSQLLLGKGTFYSPVLSNEYLDFCKRKNIFENAFLVDTSGQTIVSIENNLGVLSIVSPDSSHNQSNRDILNKTMNLSPGRVLFDSHTPLLQSEYPPKTTHPLIRFATPIHSSDGNVIGAVVLGFKSSNLLHYLPRAVVNVMDQILLVNDDGELLLGTWNGYSFVQKSKSIERPRIQHGFSNEWKKIRESGRQQFYTDNGLFSIATMGHLRTDNAVYSAPPMAENASHLAHSFIHPDWLLISHVDPSVLVTIKTQETRSIVANLIGVSALLGTFAWFLVGALVQRREKRDIIRNISQRVSALTGELFFHSLAEGLCDILNMEYAIIGKIVEGDSARIRTLAFSSNGEIAENIEYALAGTPCATVMSSSFCIYQSGVQKLFPKDDDLVHLGAESYIGIPLFDSSGKPFGIMAALGKSKLRNNEFGKHELSIFAARASAELERINSEKSLKQSEHLLKESQKAAQIGSYRCVLATGTWESSAVLDQIAGIDSNYDRTVGGWLNLVHPDYREEMNRYFFEDVIANHKTYDRQYPIIRQTDNAVRWLHASAVIECDKNNNPVEMLGTVQDITDRKKAEDALRKSENRYEELFNSLLEGVCVVDEKEMITFCNRAFALILEEDNANEVTGKTVFDYVPTENQETILQQTALRKTNRSSQYEIEIVTAKGNRRNLFVSVSPRTNESGSYCGAFANIMDITEEKRLRELESRAQRLETAGQVAGQVAHDFNNLLAPLMAYPELIRDELPDDHPAKKYLDAMERSATQIAEINEQLLTLGRRGHYNHVPIDLNQLVHQAINQNKQFHPDIEHHTNLATDLSQFTGGPAQILRVAMNLIENACDAMNDKGVITITTQDYFINKRKPFPSLEQIPVGAYVKLTISDNGSGIAKAVQPKIFDPFFSSKESDRNRGSGLGLSIVHSVVKDHGGHIDFSTQQGKGTSFYLYFPITLERVNVQDENKFTGGNESILVVDDDPLQREVALKLLDNLGYDITLAESGERAIELLSKSSYDLMILDMIMPPGMDGTETFRKALEICPEQKAIIVSGFSESDRVAEAKNLEIGAFVKKPLNRKIIAQAVRTELDRKIRSVTA